MKRRVYYDNTDAGGVVYHTEYIKFCEEARSEKFFKKGIEFKDFFYVVKSLKANYIKPAKLGDELDIKTEVNSIKRASLTLMQTIYLNKTKIFELEVELVFIKNGKISKIPKEHLELFDEK